MTTEGRSRRAIKPPRRLYEDNEEEVQVARRNPLTPVKHSHFYVSPAYHSTELIDFELGEEMPPVPGPPLQSKEAGTSHALLNHIPPPEDDDFVDAGAVDNAEDSDASEMSNEMKGDHDLNIEEFDRPVMIQSVEAAALRAGVPTRKVVSGAGSEPQSTRRVSLNSLQPAPARPFPNVDKGPRSQEEVQQPASNNLTNKLPEKPVNLSQQRIPNNSAAINGAKSGLPGVRPAQNTSSVKVGQPSVKASPPVHAPGQVRNNARLKYQEALDGALKELKDQQLPPETVIGSPSALAEQIEIACHRAYGTNASTTKTYRDKFRTLYFSLRKNKNLCKQILLGTVTPEKVIAMSKEELADEQAAKLRNMVLEKSRKRVVLDDEAAAKFSTAANQALARKELEERKDKVAEKREAEKLVEELRATERARKVARTSNVVPQHSLLSQRSSLQSHEPSGSRSKAYDPDSTPTGRGGVHDAHNAGLEEDQVSLSISDGGSQQGEQGEEVDMRDDQAGGSGTLVLEVQQGEREESPVPVYAPPASASRWVPEGVEDRDKTPPLAAGRSGGVTSRLSGSLNKSLDLGVTPEVGVLSTAAETAAAFAHVEDLAPLVLPSPSKYAAGGAPGVRLWSGYLEMHVEGMFRGEVQTMQGAIDLAAIMRGSLQVYGKLPSANLEEFFEQLMGSRTRTLTLGLLRLNQKSMDEGMLQKCKKVYDDIKNSERCAVVKPSGCEGYLIPASPFATRLCATAYMAARPRHKAAIPVVLQDFEFVLAIVHSKGSEDNQLQQELAVRLKKDSAWAARREKFKEGKAAKRKTRKERKEKAMAAQASEDEALRRFAAAASDVDAAAAAAAVAAASAVTGDPSIPQPSDPRQRRPAGAASRMPVQIVGGLPGAPVSGGSHNWEYPTNMGGEQRLEDLTPPGAVGGLATSSPPQALPQAPAARQDETNGAGAPRDDTGEPFDIGESLSKLSSALGLGDDEPAPRHDPVTESRDEELPDMTDLLAIVGATQPQVGPGDPSQLAGLGNSSGPMLGGNIPSEVSQPVVHNLTLSTPMSLPSPPIQQMQQLNQVGNPQQGEVYQGGTGNLLTPVQQADPSFLQAGKSTVVAGQGVSFEPVPVVDGVVSQQMHSLPASGQPAVQMMPLQLQGSQAMHVSQPMILPASSPVTFHSQVHGQQIPVTFQQPSAGQPFFTPVHPSSDVPLNSPALPSSMPLAAIPQSVPSNLQVFNAAPAGNDTGHANRSDGFVMREFPGANEGWARVDGKHSGSEGNWGAGPGESANRMPGATLQHIPDRPKVNALGADVIVRDGVGDRAAFGNWSGHVPRGAHAPPPDLVGFVGTGGNRDVARMPPPPPPPPPGRM